MQRPSPKKLVLASLLAILLVVGGVLVRSQSATPPIALSVDLREAPRRIFHARMMIPATPGPLTLLYPEWIPGEHGPTGPITNLTGLKFTAAGKPVAWRRDDVNMFAFHCQVPEGASAVEVELDYVSPSDKENREGRGPAATGQLAVLNWNFVLLYPQGKSTDDLTYRATLRLPEGWKFGTALPVAKQSAESIEFAPASLTTLVDSPVIAGIHYRRVPLPVAGLPSHEIDLAGESEAAVEMSPGLRQEYTQLVAESTALFGAIHYSDYHFLLALSDHVRSSGLEHHESSDNRLPERALLDDAPRKLGAGLLPHEFVHSWNGKYRRPRSLTTPDFHQPMHGELLWVYEGLTSYLGDILAPRSGLLTPQEFRENIARIAASLDHRPGRTWRPLADTAIAAQILYSAPDEWSSWRRGTDFYEESVLIWLEADTLIRQQTQGRRSLDDFCRLFHGGRSGPPEVKTYTFEDVVATLNEVAPYDWRAFFTARLNSTAPGAPLAGLEGSGWRLVYNEKPNEFIAAVEKERKITDFSFSLGLRLRRENGRPDDGTLLDVIPGMPAAQAGLAPAMKLLAVNGRKWSPEVLNEALAAAKSRRAPIELLVDNMGVLRTYSVNYIGGERYPHLERVPARPDLLSEIIKARVGQPVPQAAGKPQP